MYYINIFFIYSFLGFLFENALSLFTNTNFNSGVLYGPWTFIYGIAIFLIMMVNRFLRQYKLNRWLEVILFYIGVTSLMTLVEFSGGMLIEKLFHRVYWDYTNLRFNYGNYIALEISLLWGLFATIIKYIVTPHIIKFAKKIPKFVTVIITGLFLIDVIASLMS